MLNQRKSHRTRTDNGYVVSFTQIACNGYGDICDISPTGIQIKTLDKIEPGAITLQFKLPFFKSRETVRGVVVWLDEKKFTCGVSFHLVHDQLNDALTKYALFASEIIPN